MSRIKKALIHYLSVSESKFIKLLATKNIEVILSLKPERFPHLVGIQYLDKYNRIPSTAILNQILGKDLLSDSFIDDLDKKTKSIIKDKTKAILGDFKFDKMSLYLASKDQEIKLNDHLSANLITINYNKASTKAFAILYKKDRYDVYHPKSTLMLSKNSPKWKVLELLVEFKVQKIHHLKKTKD